MPPGSPFAPGDLARRLAEASALRQAGRWVEACAAYEEVLAADPGLADSWFNLALCRRRARRFEAALDAYAQALIHGVSGPAEVHLNRAVILSEDLDQPDAALAELERAVALDSDYLPAWLNLGNLHEDRGERDAARLAYEQALLIAPDHPLGLARLAGVTRFDAPDDALIARMTARRADARLDPENRADLEFALGRALDSVGAYDAAFDAYARANHAQALGWGVRYDPSVAERLIDDLIAVYAKPAPSADPADASPAPLFICGHFRSGSTLAERLLAGHPQVTPGGELDTLPALEHQLGGPVAAARAPQGRIVEAASTYRAEVARTRPGPGLLIDKRPDNVLRLGLAKRLFPAARIVLTRRDPRDVVLSNWMLQLGPAASQALTLEAMAHWVRQIDRLIAHWRRLWPDDILVLDYDALVRDPETHTRRLLTFAGLSWRAEVLDFADRPGAVRTASVWQVREPLYTRSSGRWRRYADRLPPDVLALGD
ncbi:tetratricopeptide repeat-containing sulfotransferase family protein [Brevundimonas lutea]|uniref:tetratricopeptide repeat-containing sulfotransferase family protein n=1 Tax=Brevundimonas lutea TaxID=2293980 RepID=UPI000F02F488|nr:sulfotransferase [Brevundimonas lutea]